MHIDILINNAGFGDWGFFKDTDLEKERQMIQLNITALTELSKLYIREMVRKGSGRVMNVSSMAGFQPGPLMAVYYATKAYVLHFSEAIANELHADGVSVTALCPGITESGFVDMADMKDSKLAKGKMPTSAEVAAFGYKAMMKGKRVAVHGGANRFLVFAQRFLPRKTIAKLTRKVQEQ
jgi:hypothetical protein